MTAAQASVGKAAAWPTTGTILMTAEPTRHGAASTPQPLSTAGSSITAAIFIIELVFMTPFAALRKIRLYEALVRADKQFDVTKREFATAAASGLV